MTAPTLCSDCTHPYIPFKGAAPDSWLCSLHRKHGGYGYVTRQYRDNNRPFLRCRDVNAGLCPLFEAKPHIRGTEDVDG